MEDEQIGMEDDRMMMEVNKAAKNVKKHMKIPNSPIPDDQWRPMTTSGWMVRALNSPHG